MPAVKPMRTLHWAVVAALVIAAAVASTDAAAAALTPLDIPVVGGGLAVVAVASTAWSPVVGLVAISALVAALYARRLARVRAAVAAATSGGDAGGFMGVAAVPPTSPMRGADLRALDAARNPPGGFSLRNAGVSATPTVTSTPYMPLSDTGSNAV